jgi:lysophospholipase L1-like esterase
MRQLFIIGASTAYGVGGAEGGWADKLKVAVHQKLYGKGGVGEKAEVYNISVPGATIAHQIERIEKVLPKLQKPDATITIIMQPGFNDAKAKDQPDNFINTPVQYAHDVASLLAAAKKMTSSIYCFGMQPIDEKRTTPKTSSDGGKTYFWNDRNMQFERTLGEECSKQNVTFVPLIKTGMDADWSDKVYADGLHPNSNGHTWFYEQIKPKVWEIL